MIPEKNIIAKISNASVEIPNDFFVALELEEILGQSSLKIGKAGLAQASTWVSLFYVLITFFGIFVAKYIKRRFNQNWRWLCTVSVTRFSTALKE